MFKIKTQKGYLVISKELIVVLILDVFVLAYFITTRGLSTDSLMMPTFLMVGCVVFSIICIRQGIHRYKEMTPEIEKEIDKAPGFGISLKLLLFALLVIACVLLFKVIGAMISMWAFILSAMILLDVRSKWVLILVPIIEVIFIYFVFKVWLAVPLPTGALGLF